MKYYINGKEVDYDLICKYSGILLFCSTWEEHNIKQQERYVTDRLTTDEEKKIGEELENELLQLP